MGQQIRVLIIDDNKDDQNFMQKAIQRSGLDAQVIIAQDGEEGIRKATQLSSEAIIILDTRLPGMDGFETCRKLKEMNEDFRVIMCTGIIDAVNAGKARSAGADDYCVKTADGGALIKAIRNLIDA